METKKTMTAINNAEYQQNDVEDLNKGYLNDTKESYKKRTLEILNNKEVSFSEFIDTQADETDLARILGAKEGAMLNRQLSMLGLHKTGSLDSAEESSENKNSTFGAPNKTVRLGGFENAA